MSDNILSPAALRSAYTSKWIRFGGEYAPMLADAIEIADSCARADIECGVPHEGELPGAWYDLSKVAEADQEMIGLSVRYLTRRGLLERHPEHETWVRPKEG